jgi:hypothetical protein
MKTKHQIFSSKNLSEVYGIYEQVSDQFLKQFKFHAEFMISSYTSDKNSVLSVLCENSSQVKWLENKALELSQRNLKKVVQNA